MTVRIPIPALLTSRSSPPSRSHTSSTAAVTEASSRTSSSTPMASGPSRCAAARARASSRLVATTRAPAALSAAAIAAPRPLVAPVTIARVPASSLTSREPNAGRLNVVQQETERSRMNTLVLSLMFFAGLGLFAIWLFWTLRSERVRAQALREQARRNACGEQTSDAGGPARVDAAHRDDSGRPRRIVLSGAGLVCAEHSWRSAGLRGNERKGRPWWRHADQLSRAS